MRSDSTRLYALPFAALLLLGALLRAGAPLRMAQADEPAKKPTADKTDPPKPPEAPKKEPEKKVKFAARGLEWPKVFDWLTRETNKPILLPGPAPSGSFTIFVPEGAEYTLPQ